jgi:HPt (histidine-containing phosphotransfer) domain-containing protein
MTFPTENYRDCGQRDNGIAFWHIMCKGGSSVRLALSLLTRYRRNGYPCVRMLSGRRLPTRRMRELLRMSTGETSPRPPGIDFSMTSPEHNNSCADNVCSSELWNPAVALRRMGGDRELLSDMVTYFLEDSPVLMTQLQAFIGEQNHEESSRVAHSLKGLCANFEAEGASRAAEVAEIAFRNGDFKIAESLRNQLSEEIQRLASSLTAWQSKNSGSDG